MSDPDGETPIGLVGFGIGASVGFATNVAAQLIQNEGNWSCVNWGNAGWSALTGETAGFLLTTPLGLSLGGVAGIGAGTNLLNYGLTNSPQDYSGLGAGAAVTSGAVGGLIGGTSPNPFLFIKPSPFLSDNFGLIPQMIAPKVIWMNTLGGIVGSYDYTKGVPKQSQCGCN